MRPSFKYHHSPFASRIAASHRGAVPDQRVKFRRRRCNCARSTARSSQVALLILLGIHCSTRWILIQLSLISSAAYATVQGHACSVHLQTGRSNAIRQEPRCSILHRCPSIRSRDASNAHHHQHNASHGTNLLLLLCSQPTLSCPRRLGLNF